MGKVLFFEEKSGKGFKEQLTQFDQLKYEKIVTKTIWEKNMSHKTVRKMI